MTETARPSTPKLNAALAKFQAALPEIKKGNTAHVEGKDGKKGYDYSYADLADVAAVVEPKLGGFGLAFNAKPTLNEKGQFVLAYSLRHESGEEDPGEFPLPNPLQYSPQQVGSAITYARRYSLCASTGVAPAGDDDDGHAAKDTRSGGRYGEASPFDQPAGESQDGSQQTRRQPARRPEPAPQAAGTAPEVVTDQEWLNRILPLAENFKTSSEGEALWRQVEQQKAAGKCSSADANHISRLMHTRKADLAKAAVPKPPQLDPSDAWYVPIKEAGPGEIDGLDADFEQQCKTGAIKPGTRAVAIRAALDARRAELGGQAVTA